LFDALRHYIKKSAKKKHPHKNVRVNSSFFAKKVVFFNTFTKSIVEFIQNVTFKPENLLKIHILHFYDEKYDEILYMDDKKQTLLYVF